MVRFVSLKVVSEVEESMTLINEMTEVALLNARNQQRPIGKFRMQIDSITESALQYLKQSGIPQLLLISLFQLDTPLKSIN